jgi:hypothetical protein
MSISLLLPSVHSAFGMHANVQLSQNEVKKLDNKYSLFKKAHKEFDEATEAYDKCAENICFKEKQVFDSVRQRRIKYHAYDACLRQNCPAEYQRYHKALYGYQNRVIGLVLGIYAGVVGGVLLLTGGALVASDVAMRKQIDTLIKKYDLDDDQKTRTILMAFRRSRSIHVLNRDSSIREPLRNALAELFFRHEPSEQEQQEFDTLLRGLNIIVKPSLR